MVKLMGDGILAEFPSVVEAVQCAANIQEQIVSREGDLPAEQRLRLRICINLGDIIVEGADIYGDGVNVAASAFQARFSNMSPAKSAATSPICGHRRSRTSSSRSGSTKSPPMVS